jgi:hypothetical protein
VALVGEESVSGVTAEPPPGQSGASTHARLYHLQRRNHAVPRSARRSRASDAQREKLTGQLGSWRRLSECWHATAKAGRQKGGFSQDRDHRNEGGCSSAAARGTTPAKPAGGKRASPTLGERVLALADGKTQQEITAACRGAPEPCRRRHCRHKRAGRIELPDGSSTPRSRRRRSNAPRSAIPLAELTRKLDAVPEGPPGDAQAGDPGCSGFLFSADEPHGLPTTPSTPAGRQNRGLLFLDAGHTATGWGGLSTGGGGVGLGGSSIGGR